MVNFDCLSVGLEVEFQIEKNLLQTGVVRYKGPINGQEGDWVGVEANQAVGSSDGRLGGRVYFKCPDKHGLFLSPHQLRLSRKKSAARKLYKSVDSYCDDLLFKKMEPKDYIACITEDYLDRAKSSFEKQSYDDIFSSYRRIASLRTLIFNPKVKKSISAEKSEPFTDTCKFHPVSSISKTFMPQEELKLYTKLSWSHKNIKNLPRNQDFNKTFDSFNLQRSNYIEPNQK